MGTAHCANVFVEHAERLRVKYAGLFTRMIRHGLSQRPDGTNWNYFAGWGVFAALPCQIYKRGENTHRPAGKPQPNVELSPLSLRTVCRHGLVT